MRLLQWVPVLGLALIALEQVVDHERIEAVRRRPRAWRETSKSLSADDSRAVGRAVRRGVAVIDPWLADAAVEMADSLAGQPPRSALRWISDAVFVGWLLAVAVVNGLRQDWLRVAVGVVGVLLFCAGFVAASRFRTRAQAALAANRAVPRPRPPAAPVARREFDLGIGLPDAVARARRRRDPGSDG